MNLHDRAKKKKEEEDEKEENACSHEEKSIVISFIEYQLERNCNLSDRASFCIQIIGWIASHPLESENKQAETVPRGRLSSKRLDERCSCAHTNQSATKEKADSADIDDGGETKLDRYLELGVVGVPPENREMLSRRVFFLFLS